MYVETVGIINALNRTENLLTKHSKSELLLCCCY